ncbi:hypothetical protein GCM10020367_11340 [Streptomyces sannanensis]|uniref:Uncharacterized protein n=1 Tax=Streptomyces sannanensis TaxID=285536 RepID=A0ABP6S6B2_9ACTN
MSTYGYGTALSFADENGYEVLTDETDKDGAVRLTLRRSTVQRGSAVRLVRGANRATSAADAAADVKVPPADRQVQRVPSRAELCLCTRQDEEPDDGRKPARSRSTWR